MATATRTSTPPPSKLHTPTTPRFGKDDTYEPYSPRRKSARVSQRSAHTPPHLSRTGDSPKSSKRKVAYTGIATSPPSSPQTAPKKTTPKNSPSMGQRRVSGALDYETTASAATALGIPAPRNQSKMEAQRSAVRNNGMLPTPAKTPKKPSTDNKMAISSVARNLFPIRGETDEVMPSPKKKGRKRYTGFTLDSFGAEEEDPIAIYTDSNDRVPEVDMSSDNPFYGDSSPPLPDPVKRSSKRRKISIPGEDEAIAVEDAEHRDDGLVYVFRGKKIFRKFTEAEAESHDQDDAMDQELLDADIVDRQLDRPLTRSAVKPRLLFPTRRQLKAKEMRDQAMEDEEEAITDIEEQAFMDHTDEMMATPKAPRFAPASPPTTARVTRSKDVNMSSSPAAQTSDDESVYPSRSRSGNNSPFSGWKQTKNVGGGAKKRAGEPLNNGKNVKKTRG